MEVNNHEAKTHLSRLLERVAVEGRPNKRRLGSAKGQFTVPDDFNDLLPKQIEELFCW